MTFLDRAIKFHKAVFAQAKSIAASPFSFLARLATPKDPQNHIARTAGIFLVGLIPTLAASVVTVLVGITISIANLSLGAFSLPIAKSIDLCRSPQKISGKKAYSQPPTSPSTPSIIRRLEPTTPEIGIKTTTPTKIKMSSSSSPIPIPKKSSQKIQSEKYGDPHQYNNQSTTPNTKRPRSSL